MFGNQGSPQVALPVPLRMLGLDLGRIHTIDRYHIKRGILIPEKGDIYGIKIWGGYHERNGYNLYNLYH
jgi:hypothetical protein